MKKSFFLALIFLFISISVKSQKGISDFCIGMSIGKFIDFIFNERVDFNKIKKINAYLVEDKYLDENNLHENILYELVPSKSNINNYLKDDIKFYEAELFNDTLRKFYIKIFSKGNIQLKNVIFVFYKNSLKYIKCQENGIGLNFSKEFFSEAFPNNFVDSIFKNTNAIKYDFYTVVKNLYKREKDSSYLYVSYDTCNAKKISIIKNTDQSDFWVNDQEKIILSIRKYFYSFNCETNYLNRIECYDVNFYAYYINNIKGIGISNHISSDKITIEHLLSKNLLFINN